MGQGSQLAKSVQSGNWNVERVLQASRIATISAWAVGSQVDVTWLLPRPTTAPARTTTQPKGPPRPERTPSTERRIASLIKFSLLMGCVSGSHGTRAQARHGTLKVTQFNEEVICACSIFRP